MVVESLKSYKIDTFVCVESIRRHQIFSGVIGRKLKSPRKIFAAPPACKKKGFPNFSPALGFFVMEPLKTVKETVKTA